MHGSEPVTSGYRCEVRKTTEALDHGDDEFFDFLGLHFGFGEELGGAETEVGFFAVGDVPAGVDDEREGSEGGLFAEPLDEGETVSVGQGEVEDEQIGAARNAAPDGLLARGGVLDADVCFLEAGDNDAGEVLVVFDEEHLCGAFATMEDTAEFGEEEGFVEGLLHPSLGRSGELAAQGGGEDAENDDGDGRGCGCVAKTLEGLPTAEAGHVEVEEDSFDLRLAGNEDGLLAGRGFENVVALAGEVLADDGTNARIVVTDEDGALAARQSESGRDGVGGAGDAGEHDVEGGPRAEIALRPDGTTVLLDDAAADGQTEAGATFLTCVGGLYLVEAIEDGVEHVGRNAAAFVGDFEEDGVGGGLDVNADGGGGRGEFDRVREQVGDHLQDAVGVAVEVEGFGAGGGGRAFDDDADGGFVRHAGHGFGGLLDEIAEGAATDLEGSAAGLHALQVEDVVDEANEPVGVGDGDAKEVLGFGIEIAHDAGGQQAEGAADAGEGGAEFVGDGGDELVFKGVEMGALFQLFLILPLTLLGLVQALGEIATRTSCFQKQEQQRERGCGADGAEKQSWQEHSGNQCGN